MTKEELYIQTKSTNRTDFQTDRVLQLGQLTKEKEIASPSHYLKFLLASRIPKAFGSTFGFAPKHQSHTSAKPKEPFFANTHVKNSYFVPLVNNIL
jgi:hypothetical protein